MLELNNLRTRFGLFLVALLWLHVPVVTVTALALHCELAAPTAIAVLLAAAYHLTWHRYGIAPVTRYLSAVALIGEPALLVYLFAGHPWQMDLHMYFFAALALSIAWYDWRVLLVAAATIALHHLVLDFLLPEAIFPLGADLGRVLLHILIVALQTAVLIWLSGRLGESFERVQTMSAEIKRNNDSLELRIQERTEELSRTAALLYKTSEQMGAIVEASPLAIMAMDASQIMTVWNQAAETMLGYDASEIVGHGFRPEINVDDKILKHLAPLENGESVPPIEGQFRRKDGKIVQVIVSGASYFDSAGRSLGQVGLVTDVTERNAMQAQLRHAQKMEAVGQLTGGLAHDFNNLLGVVLGNLDILQESQEAGSDARALTDVAINAAVRGAELTRQLLAYSRQQPLAPELTDLHAVLSDSARLLGRVLGEQVRLNVKIAPDLWPLLIDPSQLESAILNLAVNARDAMPNGGVLTLEAENIFIGTEDIERYRDLLPGNYVALAISDTGSGMTSEVRAKAFDPFFTTKGLDGSGLGLSMVHGFVKQSGGNTEIYSEPGVGTTIKMYLPRAEAGDDRMAQEQAVAIAGAVAKDGEVVLVVEDNKDLRDAALLQLHALGYRTVASSDGHQALEILAGSQQIDLLFTDMVMPGGIDGHKLADTARKVRPGLRVLLTSGFSGSCVSTSNGAPATYDLLRKPYRKDELALRVRAAIDRPPGTNSTSRTSGI